MFVYFRYCTQEQEQYAYADPNANQSTQERCDTYSYVTVRPDATTVMAAGGTGEYKSIHRPKQWEVPKRNVRLDKKLGSGHFGMVMKGFLKTKQGTQVVAVKMLKGWYACKEQFILKKRPRQKKAERQTSSFKHFSSIFSCTLERQW